MAQARLRAGADRLRMGAVARAYGHSVCCQCDGTGFSERFDKALTEESVKRSFRVGPGGGSALITPTLTMSIRCFAYLSDAFELRPTRARDRCDMRRQPGEA